MTEQERPKFTNSLLVAICVLVACCTHARAEGPTIVAIPGGESGVGFDDLQYSSDLNRVIIPAAQTGAIYLIDPSTLKLQAISGFTASSNFHGGHGEGVTSADVCEGLLFATDRSSQMLGVFDAASHTLVGSAKLAGGPDYVRCAADLREVWVTEPRDKRIELFSFAEQTPTPAHIAFIEIPGGPESLIIDEKSGRAFTNLWTDSTIVIDLKSRRETARWPNGCAASRGLALDSSRNLLMAGCEEGKLEVLDAKSGRHLGEAASGKGVDIIAYSPKLGRAYLPGADSATMATIAISTTAAPQVLDTVVTARGAHCATADDRGHIYVCDPEHGRILVFSDGLKH